MSVYWSERNTCAAFEHCKQNVVVTFNGVISLSSAFLFLPLRHYQEESSDMTSEGWGRCLTVTWHVAHVDGGTSNNVQRVQMKSEDPHL
jgi:hypothetical protein